MAKEKGSKSNRPFLIYAYSREQAIEDGYLVDVSDIAAKLGFTVSTTVTAAVWKEYCEPEHLPDDPAAILRDILWLLHCAMHGPLPCRREETGGGQIIYFSIISGLGTPQEAPAELMAELGPGDRGEPVLTIMLPRED